MNDAQLELVYVPGATDRDLQRALYHADPRTSLLYVRIADGGSTTRHIVTDFLAAG